MLEPAGFDDVEIEDRWWDESDGEAKDTTPKCFCMLTPSAGVHKNRVRTSRSWSPTDVFFSRPKARTLALRH
jgi:hypothetical protein